MKIIAISDLHGQFPDVPPCDLLIVAGDLCPDGFGGVWARHDYTRQLRWFHDTFLPWVSPKAKTVLVTWGNHDFCGHQLLSGTFGNVSVVVDAMAEVDGITLWLTPWSNEFMDWAFMKPYDRLASIYAEIPEGIDILVSHQPPKGYGDLYLDFKTGKMEHIASSELLFTIERVKPRIVVCGHLHGGYGTYQRGETSIYNVSVVNEQYKLTNQATELCIFKR